MSTGFTGKERAFVDSLAGETGRDLAHWMSAIGALEHAHRNDIIDWLRQQGFTFAKASWLERIHHNGGRLIYADQPVRAPLDQSSPGVALKKASPGGKVVLTSADDDHDIEALLLAAKAYRPLAQALLRECLAAVPGADAAARKGLIILSHASPFAAIAPTPKDVRLYLSLTPEMAAAPWQNTKVPPGLDALSGLSHMLSVTDARQLTRELRDLMIASARETAHPHAG